MYRTDSMGGATNVPPPENLGLEVPPRLPARTLLDRSGKRCIDIVAAVIFLVVGLPLCVFIALGIRLTSPGPILYWQLRVGQHGRRFRFYKFRSMYVDGERQLTSLLATDEIARSTWQIYQKLDNDPRITPFGRFIRRSSLDELPQLWNVLRGDMSLVGPRPCMEEQERLYGRHWAIYCSMKPGLTGLWQVSGRNRLSYMQRVQLDARYVQEWSHWLDAKILLKTVSVVFTGDGSS